MLHNSRTTEIPIPAPLGSTVKFWAKIPTITGKSTIAPNVLVLEKNANNPPINSMTPTNGKIQGITINAAKTFLVSSGSSGVGI